MEKSKMHDHQESKMQKEQCDVKSHDSKMEHTPKEGCTTKDEHHHKESGCCGSDKK